MAHILLGDYRIDPQLNEVVGDVTQSTGASVNLIKPLYIQFYANENFQNALHVDGSMAISLDADFGGSINIGGNVDIGSNLHVIGEVTGERYNTLSDRRLKTNIVPLDVSIMGVNVYKYSLNNSTDTTYGLMAQELLTHPEFKQLVSCDPDTGIYSVDYIQFIPVLIKEIQLLKKALSIAIVGIVVIATFIASH